MLIGITITNISEASISDGTEQSLRRGGVRTWAPANHKLRATEAVRPPSQQDVTLPSP